MKIKANGYYNDPNIARAASNLSSLFAPPSARDEALFANAAAKRAEAARLSELYDYSKMSGVDREAFDRRAIGAGAYNPTQSYYKVDADNRTTLDTTRMNNERAIQERQLQESGLMNRQMAQPVILSEGQTANLPSQTQAATGLAPTLRGNINVKPGEITTTPAGEVFAGVPKPLSQDEAKAQEMQAMRKSGAISDAQMNAMIFGNTPIQSVQTPQGPRYTTGPEALGQQPVPATPQGQPRVMNYKDPAGKVGTAVQDAATGKLIDTQTREEIAPGSQSFSANLQGDKEQTGLGISTKNSVEKQMLSLAGAESTSKQLRALLAKNPASQGLVGSIQGTVQDMLATGGEIATLLGSNRKAIDDAIANGGVAPDLMKQFQSYNSSIPAAEFLRQALIFQAAQALNDGDKVSNEDMRRVESMLGQSGTLQNFSRSTAALDQLDAMMADRRERLKGIAPAAAKIGQAPGAPQAPAPGAPPAAPERWVRGPDGKLMKAQ